MVDQYVKESRELEGRALVGVTTAVHAEPLKPETQHGVLLNERIWLFILESLLYMINCFILMTKQPILCGQYKEKIHVDKLAGVERVKHTIGTHPTHLR